MVKPLHEYDFFNTDIARPENYDVESDLYLSEHFVELIAIDAQRVEIIAVLVEEGFAEVREDGFAYLNFDTPAMNADFLKGMRSGSKWYTRTGRFERQAWTTLIEEMKATGRLKVKLLPDFPGFAESDT